MQRQPGENHLDFVMTVWTQHPFRKPLLAREAVWLEIAPSRIELFQIDIGILRSFMSDYRGDGNASDLGI
jgi:hypothetical protein